MAGFFKKALALFIALTMALSVCGCSRGQDDSTSSNNSEDKPSSSEPAESTLPEEPDYVSSEPAEAYTDDLSDDEEIFMKHVKLLNGTPVQQNFLGFNVVYHPFTYMNDKWGRNYSEEMAEYELNRLKASGANIVRGFIEPKYAYDSASGTWNFDSDDMNAVYRWCDELNKRNIEVCLSLWNIRDVNTVYYHYSSENDDLSVTSELFEGFRVYKDDGVTIDQKASHQKFADYVVELLKQLKARGYNNVKYLLMYTEPGLSYNFSTGSIKQEDYLKMWGQNYLEPVAAVDKALSEAGLRNGIKIIGPNTGDSLRQGGGVKWIADNAPKDTFDYFSSHSYCRFEDGSTDSYADWDEMIKVKTNGLSGKPFIFDEYNWLGDTNFETRADSAWWGVQQAIAEVALLSNGVDGCFLWTLFDQQFPNTTTSNADSFKNGIQYYGLVPSLFNSSVPHKAYYQYTMAQHFLGVKGSKIYAGENELYSGLYTAAALMPDGNFSIIVVNTDFVDTAICIDLEKSINKTLYRHLYNPSSVESHPDKNMISADCKFTNVKTQLVDVLPGGGVAVYTSAKLS